MTVIRASDQLTKDSAIARDVASLKAFSQEILDKDSKVEVIGVVIAGSGLEASIVLNKFNGIRAALVSTYYLA